MTKRLALIFISLVISFSALSYLLLSDTISRSRVALDRQQLDVYHSVSAGLVHSYSLINSLLELKKNSYLELHQIAVDHVINNGSGGDLLALKAELEKRANFSIDVFVINSNLVVSSTTFPPDVGLDFKLPPFVDVQNSLKFVRENRTTFISPPTMEIVSKEFKIYSYSRLPNGQYLELGFIDPQLNVYFESLLRQTESLEGVQVELFFEMWGNLLTRLGEDQFHYTGSKNEMVKQQVEREKLTLELFQKAQSRTAPYIRKVEDNGATRTEFYSELMTIRLLPSADLTMRILARVSADDTKVVTLQNRITLFYWAIFLLSLVTMGLLFFVIRSKLIVPLNKIVIATQSKQPVAQDANLGAPELRSLANSYNLMLAKLNQQLNQKGQTRLMNQKGQTRLISALHWRKSSRLQTMP